MLPFLIEKSPILQTCDFPENTFDFRERPSKCKKYRIRPNCAFHQSSKLQLLTYLPTKDDIIRIIRLAVANRHRKKSIELKHNLLTLILRSSLEGLCL